MTKIIIALILTFCLLVGFSACGSGGSSLDRQIADAEAARERAGEAARSAQKAYDDLMDAYEQYQRNQAALDGLRP